MIAIRIGAAEARRGTRRLRAGLAGYRRAAVGLGIGILMAVVAAPSSSRADDPPAPVAANPSTWKLPPEVRVGTTPNYPPIAFERDGKIVGIEADFAAELAKILGVKFTLVAIPWDELSAALAGKEIDVVMAGVSITPRRKNLVHFTAPYLKVGQMALIRKEDLARLSPPDAMNKKGMRVGAVRLTTGARYAREHLEQATIVEFDSSNDGLEALREEKIDYFIHDAPTVWRVTGRFDEADEALIGIYRPLTDEELAWGVRKEDADTLGKALDGALAKLQESGTAQAILDRWIPVRKVSKTAPPPR
jgi:polar amino acid transport system substrate-binding protein